MTMHLLYGEEAYLLNEEKNRIIQEVNPFSVSVLDMRETPLGVAIEEARTIDLFGDNKTIILQNCVFLTGDKPGKIEHDIELLIQYLAAPNPSTTMVFMVSNAKLDKRKKVVKSLQKEAKSFEAKPLRNVHSFIQKIVKGHSKNISNDACIYVQQRLGINLFLLQNELDKVCLAYMHESIIEISMLENILSRTLEDDVFKLIERIVQKQPSSLEIVDDLFRLGQEPIAVVLLMARQFRILHQVKVLQDRGEKPSSVLKIHPYALQIAEEQAEIYTLEELQAKLETLAIIDLQMKRGEVDKVIALETLILKWL